MIATITLNPSIDQTILLRGLVKDDANRALSIERDPGGKGLNVSKVVKSLGGQTHAYALTGGLTGELWKELVRSKKIPFTAVQIDGETRINIILTDTKDRTQTRVSAPGPFVPRRPLEQLVKTLTTGCPKPYLWALGGSLSSGMRPTVYRDIIRRLQAAGTPCILDTDNEALKFGIEANPFMIKPNEFEMQRLVGRKLHSIQDYAKCAKRISDKGIRIVVVSLGSRGALFVTRSQAIHVTTPRVRVKNKVGAGDSLIGGFALGLHRGLSFEEAAQLGVAASTSAIMTGGSSYCCRSDIPKILPRLRTIRL